VVGDGARRTGVLGLASWPGSACGGAALLAIAVSALLGAWGLTRGWNLGGGFPGSGVVASASELHSMRGCTCAEPADADLRRLREPLVLRAIFDGASRRWRRAELGFLFADLRGFTALSERNPPEQVLALLNRYSRRSPRLHRHGGTIDNFRGMA
jgi:hypothetical protein